jgi:hypothetical protein
VNVANVSKSNDHSLKGAIVRRKRCGFEVWFEGEEALPDGTIEGAGDDAAAVSGR